MVKECLAAISIGVLISGAAPASGSDLTIKLAGSDRIERKTVQFVCDRSAAKLGLPSGPFAVEYINGAGNSLALLPVSAKTLIFVTVPSGSGARYASGPLTWSDGGSRGAFLSSDLLGQHAQTLCHMAGAPGPARHPRP
jgi:membrane-bound inhibitor of C-type lysozyme